MVQCGGVVAEAWRGRRVQVLGVPRENRFRGSVTAELEVKDMALIAESDPC